MGLDFITAATVAESRAAWKRALIGAFICLLSLVSRVPEAQAST